MKKINTKKLKTYNQGNTLYCTSYAMEALLEALGKKNDPIKIFNEVDARYENNNKGGISVPNVIKWAGMKLNQVLFKNIYSSKYRAKKKFTEKDIQEFKKNNDYAFVVVNGFRYIPAWKMFIKGKRFYPHAMFVVDIDEKYIYAWNSWGDGLVKIDYHSVPIIVLYGVKLQTKTPSQTPKMSRREEIIRELKHYFSIKELVPEDIFKIHKERAWRVFDTRLLENLLFMRKDLGKSFYVNNYRKGLQYRGYDNGYRPKTSLSYHKLGKAIDFTVKGMTPNQVRDYIRKNYKRFPYPAGRIEVLKKGKPISWVHYDIGAEEGQLLEFNV